MLEHFSNLNEDETKQLLDALPLITVLIAGADGNFEKDEMDWAEKVTHIRSYKLKEKPFSLESGTIIFFSMVFIKVLLNLIL